MSAATHPSSPGAARDARAAPPRVALVISHLSDGGAERVATTLAGRWTASASHVTLVTLASPDGVLADRYPVPPGVRRVALGLLRPSRNKLVGALRAIERIRALRGALRVAAPDVVLSFGDRTNVQTLLATAGTGLPTFVSERTDPRHAATAWPWRALRRALYGFADGVVVQTESVAAWAVGRWGRVVVIPNFVTPPPALASPAAAVAEPTVLALGRLERVKGFDLLIEAFARIAAAHPTWRLRIVGEGDDRPRLEALVARLGLAGRVALPGRVADPTPELARAQVFALSSLREGFPNALLEAMACGLAVVSFDCPSGPSEIVSDGVDGILVPPADVDGLAAALDRLLRDPAERARLGGGAREVTARFSVDRVLALWSDLLCGRARART